MIIEKSSYHPNNINQKNIKNKLNSSDNKKITTDDNFGFFKWMKGVINPLQNLPIVSGIYSSINSENKESDRDLVQNSLGGFLYGGPIGAVAGFGNWLFNKIFDSTPTEIVMSFTGLDQIWKDKRIDGKKFSKNETLNNEIINKKEIPDSIKQKQIESFPKSNKIINNNKENTKTKYGNIELSYPKWYPKEEKFIKINSKELSSLNKLYHQNNKIDSKKTFKINA